MLEITRTPDGRLLVSTNRFSEEVDTEEEARRFLTAKGWGNLSITKALHRLNEAEGTAAPLQGWTVRRPEPAPVAEKAAEPARPRRKKAAEPPTPEPTPEEEKPPAHRKRRSRRKAAAEPAVETATPPTAEAAPEPVAEPVPEPAPEAPARKPRKPRKSRAKAAPEPVVEASPAPEPELAREEPEKKPRRAARKKAERAAAPADPAVHHAAELARALRERERAVLPFARGPWTELRQAAERMLACLEGREPGK